MTDFEVVEGRRRAVVENIQPQIDCGRYPIKRIVGDKLIVEADVFADGHDAISAALLFASPSATDWQRVPLVPTNNDRWQATFDLSEIGECRYTVQGWIDHFLSWHRDLKKRVEAGQNLEVDLLIGAQLVAEAAERAAQAEPQSSDDVAALENWTKRLREASPSGSIDFDSLAPLAQLMERYPDLRWATTYEPPLRVTVDRERARFSTWYELFPRSASPVAGRHGTFADVIARLPYIAEMGFDVLYLPPIHPIGQMFRKGRNNTVTAQPDEPGSPWAIGAAEGGHTDILAELGTLADFKRLIAAAKERGIEIALDIAFQCAPDHPYVKEHPDWFRARPDGTIQYAENPPKKYQDIYPFDFESKDWHGLWSELKEVFAYWAKQGVRIFRVDNPHTKAFSFWQWAIAELKREFPDLLFLAEAFTRPKPMYRLAKLGFSQSYTYFTWRNGKQEFIEYFTELTESPVSEFFRPNLWPNTPDILPDHLQHGGQAAFQARYILAATLSSNIGIYGPAYELQEHEAIKPGSEEYLDSEKYEVRWRDLNASHNLSKFIGRINRARRNNPALQQMNQLRFHEISNDQLLCYSKQVADPHNLVLTVVNLDFYNTQNGLIRLPLQELGLSPDRPYRVHDLLSETTFTWHTDSNFVELDPHKQVAHMFRVEQ